VTDQEAVGRYGAQMYLPSPRDKTGKTRALYYRWHTRILNTGEFVTCLQYLSFADTWQGSFDRDRDSLVASLVQIPGVPVHDPKAAAEAIAADELKRWGKDEYDRITKLRAANKERYAREEEARRR
jgi:hypothetical protein